jgi:hypothetical protein
MWSHASRVKHPTRRRFRSMWVTDVERPRLSGCHLTILTMLFRRFRRLVVLSSSAVIVAASACVNGSTDPERVLTGSSDPLVAKLIGSWTFVQACGGIAGQCRDTDPNEPTRYVFRNDDSVEAYRGSQRIYVQNYAVVPGPDSRTDDHPPALMIGFGPAVDPRPLWLRFDKDDTLLLDEGCCDRFAFEYARVR